MIMICYFCCWCAACENCSHTVLYLRNSLRCVRLEKQPRRLDKRFQNFGCSSAELFCRKRRKNQVPSEKFKANCGRKFPYTSLCKHRLADVDLMSVQLALSEAPSRCFRRSEFPTRPFSTAIISQFCDTFLNHTLQHNIIRAKPQT